jgi:hypothetical protein
MWSCWFVQLGGFGGVVGRRMRPLDPADGVVERFACELRALRAAAGEPPFWKMARRCEVSKSALAAAVAGYELPSERVMLAYVRVCGGDASWWSERLVQARGQLEAERTMPAADEPPQTTRAELVVVRHVPPVRAMARIQLQPRTRGWLARPALAGTPRARATRRLLITLAATAVLVGTALGTAALLRDHPAAPAAIAQPLSGVYDQTVGPGCPHTAVANVTQDDFAATHKWTQATAAHWNVPNCSNLIVYSAPTASSNPNRWQDDYEWYFDNVPKSAQCTFHIYIPDSPEAAYTAAYDWTTGNSTYLDSTASVLNQAAYRGQWFNQGPHSFPTGQAMMMITDARSDTPNATLTAAAVRLTCT